MQTLFIDALTKAYDDGQTQKFVNKSIQMTKPFPPNIQSHTCLIAVQYVQIYWINCKTCIYKVPSLLHHKMGILF